MTTIHKPMSRRRLDVASLMLMIIGIVFGVFSYWLIAYVEVNVLVIIPSVVAVTIGASHLIKVEAPRR